MNDLKKVLLAGIGLTAMTVDKADSFVKELVEKGRLTVEEGKELEQELKRQSKEEAQEFLNKLDAKKSSVEYATKVDVKRLEQTTPVKLRQAFEQLGPSFVKIGQILSTRSDLLPENYIKELSKLQSSVPPLNKEEVMTAIKRELPNGLSDRY